MLSLIICDTITFFRNVQLQLAEYFLTYCIEQTPVPTGRVRYYFDASKESSVSPVYIKSSFRLSKSLLYLLIDIVLKNTWLTCNPEQTTSPLHAFSKNSSAIAKFQTAILFTFLSFPNREKFGIAFLHCESNCETRFSFLIILYDSWLVFLYIFYRQNNVCVSPDYRTFSISTYLIYCRLPVHQDSGNIATHSVFSRPTFLGLIVITYRGLASCV